MLQTQCKLDCWTFDLNAVVCDDIFSSVKVSTKAYSSADEAFCWIYFSTLKSYFLGGVAWEIHVGWILACVVSLADTRKSARFMIMALIIPLYCVCMIRERHVIMKAGLNTRLAV